METISGCGASADEGAERLSDVLLEILIERSASDRGSGLLLVDMPTGYGKSYAAQNLLGRFAADPANRKRKIFYITPQKKNLPSDEDVDRAFGLAGAGLPTAGQVMRVRPLHEMLAETADWHVMECVPERFFQMGTLKDLVRAAEQYRCALTLTEKGGSFSGYVESVRSKLLEAERAFRNEISPLLARRDDRTDGGKTLSAKKRIKRLQSDPDWKWLSQLYPTVFTRDAQVFLMSVDKFLYNHVTLVEPSYRFIDSDLVKDAVVVIDEFDASKSDLLSQIINDAVESKADLPGLVGSMYSAFNSKERPAELVRPSKSRKEGGHATIDELLDGGERVVRGSFADANLKYEFKAADGETAGDFLFYDFQYNSVMGTDFTVVEDDKEKVNSVMGLESAKGEGKPLTQVLGSLCGAAHYMQGVIGSVALNYQRRKNEINGMDGGFTIDSAQKSVLEWLNIADANQRRYMLEGTRSRFRKASKGGGRSVGSALMSGDLSVYERGFHCIALEDGEDHDMKTHMLMCAMQSTPEAVMLQLIGKAKVIGLSATATVDSALCNYDLDYLAAQAPDLVGKLTDEEFGRLEIAYQVQSAGYSNVEIGADLINAEGGIEGWMKILENAEAARAAFDLVDGMKGHVRDRYARFACAFKQFILDDKASSMLALAMAAPKDKGDFCQDALRDICAIVGQCVGVESAERHLRFIEGSDHFEERYRDIRDELGSGGKVFLIAAYATVGTGVNLQYPVHDDTCVVPVFEWEGNDMRDYDCIYLDRPTNLAPYSRPIDERGLMNDLYEICELRERAEISGKDYCKAYKGLAKCRLAAGKGSVPGMMQTKSAKGKATRYVNQAIGRICRTNLKSSRVRIMADAGLAKRIDLAAMDGCLVNREYEALVEKLRAHVDSSAASSADYEERAGFVSTRLNSYIQKLVKRSTWSTEEMRFWEGMRDAALSHPTCSAEGAEDIGGLVGNTYVRAAEPVSRCTYTQKGDFDDTRVSFDPSYPLESLVSEDAARLPSLAKIPGVAELFAERGWPLAWLPNEFILSPVLFNNIYLGALGEQVGKFLLEEHILGLRLVPIEDGSSFEKFDFSVEGTAYFVDFKYWSAPSPKSAEEELDWIEKKMEKVGAERAVICNVLGSTEDGYKCMVGRNRRILTVPLIADAETGGIRMDNIDQIRTFLS